MRVKVKQIYYDLLRCDRNRNGGRVVCYIRNNLSYTQKNIFSNDIENVFFQIHLPKTKSITVGTVYQSPNQTNFIKNPKKNFAKRDTANKETYILRDFNINLYHNGKYIIWKNNTLISRSVTKDARNYHQFYAMFGSKEIIKSSTRITCRNISLIDHIIASSLLRVSQHGVINVSVSDHQFIYCTRKINKIKTGGVHKSITFRSFKSCTDDAYKDDLKKFNFPNYEHSNFFQKVRIVVDSIAHFNIERVKANTQKWFDGENLENINTRDKHFKKFKNSRLHIDKELDKKAKYNTTKLISAKKQAFFDDKLSENIGKLKELWETLKSPNMPEKTLISNFNAVESNNGLPFDKKTIAKIFKDFFSHLVKSILSKLPNVPNKYNIEPVFKYYLKFIIEKPFHLSITSQEQVYKIM